ncbi:unannotated protein [freshwater metagenome]|jgi:hypothetical protein|uniref:Unannotated protein n=1 Tax=freshwater metagenome TaxID=449393 RepID=A0A6J6YPZ2_9ZZZZ
MGTQCVVQDTTLNIAMWLERRLDMSLGFHFPAARLYGIVLNDPLGLADDTCQAARTSFLDESDDVYELMAGSAGVLARSFDAAAVVTAGWAAPMADDGSMAQRASRHPLRRRVRAVAVVSDDGVASLIRFEDDPDELIAQTTAGTGLMVDALEAMWFGTAALWADPYETLLRTSDEFASTRSCRRRR